MNKSYLFTSESVSEGHPDKICDLISDSILDEHLKGDPYSRVACETLVSNNLVVVAGEITSSVSVPYEQIVRSVLREIGYTDSESGIDPDNCKVIINISKQSPDISRGVDGEKGITGAGDQGIMFGYSTDETPEFLPSSLVYSHNLLKGLSVRRKSGSTPWLRPDSKSQVTVRYDSGTPVEIEKIVLSTQHTPDIDSSYIYEFIKEEILPTVIPSHLITGRTELLVNPTGRFVIGGPNGDTGVTGRKIIVDTYGGAAPHGGGAFSGKDPSKVDRSAAYAARYIAKNIVAARIARRCTIQLAYAIGKPDPLSIRIDFHNTGVLDENVLITTIPGLFDLSPEGIISSLGLRTPLYRSTVNYGHFGRPGLPWENTDLVNDLTNLL